MSYPVTPYKNSTSGKKEQVAAMFNNIAYRYDFLNKLLSAGIDKGWRKKTIAALKPFNPKIILDIATGTADLAIAAVTLRPEKITGIDISEKMLQYGREKIRKTGYSNRIELLKADSENIPFAAESFDAVTVAFGVRNFENLDSGLAEMYRVLRKGGIAAILEFSQPEKFPIKQLYTIYSRFIIPGIGKLFSKDSSAYTYLPESVQAFPYGKAFESIMEKNGFREIKTRQLNFGIASIYTGIK